MFTLKDVQTGKIRRRPRVLVHGVGGVGKTTFAAQSEKPIFLLTEDGLGVLDVPHFPLLKSFQDVMRALDALLTEDHDYKTVVMDSIDWLETLIWQHLNRTKNWVGSVEDQPYGVGYAAALELWKKYIALMNSLNTKRDMFTIQIAHTEIRRFDSPEHPPYDRYVIKLNSKASALNQENADIVAFVNYKTTPMEEPRGAREKKAVNSGRKTVKRTGKGDRAMYVQERPAYLAKNRYGLPDELPLSWTSLMTAVKEKWTKTDKKNPDGRKTGRESVENPTETNNGSEKTEEKTKVMDEGQGNLITNGSGGNEERIQNVS